MSDGVAHRTEAVIHGAYELLGCERSESVQYPVARPVVVVDEEAEIVVIHSVQLSPSRKKRGY
jgi:hypothetical protein